MNQRDVLLVPFPFSDQTGKKVRPVLVLSKDSFNDASEDLIVCAITSNVVKDFYAVMLDKEGFEEGAIFETSQIKTESLLKIDKNLALKKIGKIRKTIFSQVLEKLYGLFED